MGASGWEYSVPYQDDIAAALERLRVETYERGGYYKAEPDPSLQLSEDEFKATLKLDDDPDGIQNFLLEEWHKAKKRPAAVDADTLLASQPDSGTHSIIDICDGLSEHPCLFTASPLTAEQHLEIFGTDRPSRPAVLEWISKHDIGHIRARWEAAYVVSYSAAGSPERIHFVGFSGD
ncbi:hypothetical protein [Actinospica robiniae]|uniref:hypothetical protein n=1 Tax=Actinospica robiniae TaxID=304901 RepID=UPI00041B2008|nr:hypothetical protein [Actinospica robiniae]